MSYIVTLLHISVISLLLDRDPKPPFTEQLTDDGSPPNRKTPGKGRGGALLSRSPRASPLPSQVSGFLALAKPDDASNESSHGVAVGRRCSRLLRRA